MTAVLQVSGDLLTWSIMDMLYVHLSDKRTTGFQIPLGPFVTTFFREGVNA
ncbi:unnamed protein product [Ectocarpus sp. 6 AP-2014]